MKVIVLLIRKSDVIDFIRNRNTIFLVKLDINRKKNKEMTNISLINLIEIVLFDWAYFIYRLRFLRSTKGKFGVNHGAPIQIQWR